MVRLPRIEGSTARVLVVVLLVAQFAILLDTSRNNSETYDEPMYLLASRSYWRQGDFSFNREHPPLAKLLIGAPLAWNGLKLPAEYHTDGATQMRFVYELNDDPQRTLFLGRLPMILLGLLLLVYVYLYGAQLGGPRVGLLAMLATMAMPQLTGNTPQAALDLAAATFAFIALYHLGRLRLAPGPGTTLVAGITFGLAQLTKYSNLLLVPIFGLLALIDVGRERSLRPLARLLGVFMVGFTTMFLCYGCEMRTVASVKEHPRYTCSTPGEIFDYEPLRMVSGWFGKRPIPMLTYLKGFDYTKTKGEKGHASYYRGETHWPFMLKEGEQLRGWRSFYLTAMAVNTPVFLLAALVLALLAWIAMSHRRALEGPLLLFPLFLFAYFSNAPSQLGLRYILPVLPALGVMVGRLLDIDPARHRRVLAAAAAIALIGLPVALAWEFRGERGGFDAAVIGAVAAQAALGAGLVWMCVKRTTDIALRKVWSRAVLAMVLLGFAEALANHPEHLMFYNAYAGGPERGWKIVSVGNDWGQGAADLSRMQKERGWDEIAYDYYGTGIPEIYGLRYRPFNGQPVAGIVAVHAVQLTRERFKGIGNYEWLAGLEPIARANAILIFDVKQDHIDGLAAPVK